MGVGLRLDGLSKKGEDALDDSTVCNSAAVGMERKRKRVKDLPWSSSLFPSQLAQILGHLRLDDGGRNSVAREEENWHHSHLLLCSLQFLLCSDEIENAVSTSSLADGVESSALHPVPQPFCEGSTAIFVLLSSCPIQCRHREMFSVFPIRGIISPSFSCRPLLLLETAVFLHVR